MNLSRIGRAVRLRRQFSLAILVCSCALEIVPAGHGQAKTVNQLTKQLEDSSSDVRWRAVNALGEKRDPRAVEPLIISLKDADPVVRKAAAYALGMIGEPAVGPLIGALKNGDPLIREGAAVALGYIEDPRSVGPLNAAQKDANPVVRENAERALAKINAPRPAPIKAQPVAESEGTSANERKVNPTNLPFDTVDMVITQGGGYMESVGSDGEVKPSCSGISLKALHLGDHDIPLKSNDITPDCMIETRDYGDLRIKMNTTTFSVSILVTPRQERQFSCLIPSNQGKVDCEFGFQ
jgi:hypothetical protein